MIERQEVVADDVNEEPTHVGQPRSLTMPCGPCRGSGRITVRLDGGETRSCPWCRGAGFSVLAFGPKRRRARRSAP
jgi:hypothetical protein